MEFVSDIFELYPYFFEAKERQSLWSAITSSWGINILQGLDAESVKLATIIVAYGNVLLDANMYQEPDDPHHGEVMCKYYSFLVPPDSATGRIRWQYYPTQQSANESQRSSMSY
jgi:hypothetical protein